MHETTSFDVLLVKISAGVLEAVRRTPKKTKKKQKLSESLDAYFCIFRGEKGQSYRD